MQVACFWWASTLQKHMMSSKVQAQSSVAHNRTYQRPHIRGSLPAAAALRCTRCTQEADGQLSKGHIIHVDTYYQI
ncbi:unnamed protein product [Urochloa humidicola]